MYFPQKADAVEVNAQTSLDGRMYTVKVATCGTAAQAVIVSSSLAHIVGRDVVIPDMKYTGTVVGTAQCSGGADVSIAACQGNKHKITVSKHAIYVVD